MNDIYEEAAKELEKELEEQNGDAEGTGVDEGEVTEEQDGELEQTASQDTDGDTGEPEKVSEGDDTQPETVEDDDDGFPFSWKNEDKKAWKATPKETRDVVLRREKELQKLVNQKVNQANQLHQKYAPLEQELGDLAQEWRQEERPVTFEQGILRAVAFFDYFKKTDKQKFVRQVAEKIGMKAEDFIETPESSKDKEIRDLREKIERIENGTQESLRHQQTAQSQQVVAGWAKEYEVFSSAKNAFGEEKYPDTQSPAVANYMASLIPQLAKAVPGKSAQDYMKQAYIQAGGRIQTGRGNRSTDKNPNNLEAAARSGYAKGGVSRQPATYDDYGAAMEAAAEKIGFFD